MNRKTRTIEKINSDSRMELIFQITTCRQIRNLIKTEPSINFKAHIKKHETSMKMIQKYNQCVLDKTPFSKLIIQRISSQKSVDSKFGCFKRRCEDCNRGTFILVYTQQNTAKELIDMYNHKITVKSAITTHYYDENLHQTI